MSTNSIPPVCANLRKLLKTQFKRAYGSDLDANLQQRGQELWILGVDSKHETMIDLCGNIGEANLGLINAKGFYDVDAGYKVNAQNALGLSGISVDIFLLNTAHFSARSDYIEPIIVHELAHLLEQSGVVPQPQFNDEQNADAILNSLHPSVMHANMRHNKEWALHLAIGGRTILSKGLTGHASIRAYLEAAIPYYDRADNAIRAKKGW